MPLPDDDFELAGESPRPPFGPRDWILCGLATAGYAAFLWFWSHHARAAGAAACTGDGGHFHPGNISWWIPLLALPVLALAGGAIQFFRREPKPGHATAWIFLVLGLMSGIPVAGVVPWLIMPLGYCVNPGAATIHRVTLAGAGAGVRFGELFDVMKMSNNHGDSWLRLRVRNPYNPSEGDEALTVYPDDVTDPQGLRNEISEQASKAGLSRPPPPRPIWQP